MRTSTETIIEERRRLEEQLRRASINRRSLLKGAAGLGVGAAALGGGLARMAPATTAQDATTPDAEQLFYNFSLQEDPASFDFNADLYANAEPEVWAGLLTFDPDGQVVADWAESWSSNEDGSVWTFNIRPDNTGWSNGDPVTAYDFVWSFARTLSPEPEGATAQNVYSFILYDVKYGEPYSTKTPVEAEGDPLNGNVPTAEDLGLKAVDDWTLEVTLEGPRANFPQKVAYLACVPAHRPSVEEHGVEWALGNVPLISNGPFKLDRWEKGVQCLLSKNEGYWDAENISLTNVVDPIISGTNAALAFTSGEGNQQLDWTVVGASDLPRFQEDPDLASFLKPLVYPGIWMLIPSNGVPPFEALNVRKALSHAVDGERLVTVTNGLVQPAPSMVPVGVYGHIEDPEIASIQQFDPELAMSLLEDTPYAGGQNWPEITVLMRGNESQFNSNIMMEDIADQLLQNLGMEVKINELVEQPFRDALYANDAPLVWIRWWYDYPDPDNGYYDMFYGGKPAGSKRQAWTNEEFDRIVVEAKSELDPEKRLQLYVEAERIIQEDVGYIPVVYRVDQNAFKPWVKNIPVNSLGFSVPDGNIYLRALTEYVIEGRES
jgi:oligopeptide transport system substrate-binding protein